MECFKMIKAVFFDLDGTLVNSLKDLACSFNYSLSQNGFPTHETEKYKFFVGSGIPKAIERALPEENRNAETIEKCRVLFFEHYAVHFADNTSPYEGVCEVVDEIVKLNLGIAVVSNKAQSMADIVVPKIYGDTFKTVIGKREGIPAKPDPALINIALEIFGIKPCECLFVGDSGMDMAAAVNAGAIPVGVLWGFRPREELEKNGARYIIDNPYKLLDIISEFNNEL